MTPKPSQTRMVLSAIALTCGAALVAGLAAPVIKTSYTPIGQRPPAAWTIPDVRDHLASGGLELEVRPIKGPQGRPEVHLVRPGIKDADGAGVVLVTRLPDDAEAARQAGWGSAGHGASWHRFVFYGDPELVRDITGKLPPDPK